MIWLAILLLTTAALAPLTCVLLRGGLVRRGGQEVTLALHRAQLTELDRDLAEGRIAAPEHTAAVLEVQRRLLAAAERPNTPSASAARGPLVLALALVPVFAFVLYLLGGSPGLPSEPLAARIARAKVELEQKNASLADLREHLSTLDPHSEQAHRGYELLGNGEAGVGNFAAAAAAWNKALAARFDPTLAAEAAEAAADAEGRVTSTTAILFRQALQAAPVDAPWRPIAERRLSEYAAGAKGVGSPASAGK
jgi:cytochrome c-type biogenesis protein CcmH